MNRFKKKFGVQSISVKLTRAIFFTSTIVTFVVSTVIFYIDYTRDKRLIDSTYTSARLSSTNSLLAAIAKDDLLQVQLQSDGLAQLPGVQFVRIKDEKNEGLATSGLEERELSGIRWIRWDIDGVVSGSHKKVGRVEMALDSNYLFKITAEKAAIFYFSQFIKTMVTIWILIYLIDRNVVRHLKTIALYFRNADGVEIAGGSSLVLDRKKRDDEIQFLVDVINKMHRLIWYRYADQRQLALNLDKELKRNAEASLGGNAIHALSELAAGVAHQINNPLAILEGYLFLAKKQVSAESVQTDKILELIDSSHKTVRRIAYVTQQLLTFSAQGVSEPFVKISMQELFKQLRLEISLMEKEFGIRVELPSIEQSETFELVCRKEQVVQTLSALIKNSLEAVEQLDERWVKVSFSSDDLFFEFTVIDSGKSLTADQESKVFTPFYTTKMGLKNVGLGLTLAQGIAEAHRGRITIQNYRPNSTITFTISRLLNLTQDSLALKDAA